MAAKSERLRKLESEFEDLKKWLDLGLVPKNDLKRHKDEIIDIERKIVEELERLELIKQNGQGEEFVAPKRQSKAAYSDTPTSSDLDLGDNEFEEEGVSYETETADLEHTQNTSYDTEAATSTTEETSSDEEWQEDPFHEKNRWKRRDIVDPDADEW
jgi:LPS O-antigen subunit length determinant protein (WzzB/FepE family)